MQRWQQEEYRQFVCFPDDCASGPCRYGSECKDGVNTFTCNCDTTVSTGTLCETRVDSCASSSCRDTATCHAFADNIAVCLCKPGYEPGETLRCVESVWAQIERCVRRASGNSFSDWPSHTLNLSVHCVDWTMCQRCRYFRI